MSQNLSIVEALCAEACLSEYAAGSGCESTDINCICQIPHIIADLECCMVHDCHSTGWEAIKFAESVCAKWIMVDGYLTECMMFVGRRRASALVSGQQALGLSQGMTLEGSGHNRIGRRGDAVGDIFWDSSMRLWRKSVQTVAPDCGANGHIGPCIKPSPSSSSSSPTSTSTTVPTTPTSSSTVSPTSSPPTTTSQVPTYTTSSTPSASIARHESISSGALAGIIIAIVLGLILIILLIFFFLRRRKSKKDLDQEAPPGLPELPTQANTHEVEGDAKRSVYQEVFPHDTNFQDNTNLEIKNGAHEIEGVETRDTPASVRPQIAELQPEIASNVFELPGQSASPSEVHRDRPEQPRKNFPQQQPETSPTPPSPSFQTPGQHQYQKLIRPSPDLTPFGESGSIS